MLCALALAGVALFFFDFISVKLAGQTVNFTGFQAAFGASQKLGEETINTFKGAWYILAFVISALGLAFSGLTFKFGNKMRVAAIAANFALALNLTVLYLSNTTAYFDDRITGGKRLIGEAVGSLGGTSRKEIFFLAAIIVAVLGFAVAIGYWLTADLAEVADSKGSKKPISKRFVRFIKDYVSEIKKIIWPDKENVTKNTTIVIIMCAVVGAYIWLWDFGLAQLLQFILSLKK